MKKVFVIAGLAFGLIACNDSSNSHSSETDSTHHSVQPDSNLHQSGADHHMKSMHEAMNSMMAQMQGMKPTGDADYDFAMMMKHHHQGAIDMARTEIAGGKDEQLKRMAQKAIDEQQKENAQFDQYMQGKSPAGNSDYGQKAMGMMTPMSNIQMESSSLDAMFASMMIPHHQDGINMAKEYLRVGKREELKKIAKSITETQPREIEELQNWLNNHKN